MNACSLLVLLLPSLYAQKEAALQQGAPWPTTFRNQYGLAQSPFSGPTSGSIQWLIQPGVLDKDIYEQFSPAVIGATGHIYLRNNETLFAISSEGSVAYTVDLAKGKLIKSLLFWMTASCHDYEIVLCKHICRLHLVSNHSNVLCYVCLRNHFSTF